MAILFSKNLQHNWVKKIINTQARYIVAHIKVEDTDYLLCNIYAPTQDHEVEQLITLEHFSSCFKDLETENLIIGGDFNEVLDPVLERKNSGVVNKSRKYRSGLSDLMDRCAITDVWRIRHSKTRRYSFHRKAQASRIDFWLISDHLLNKVAKNEIETGVLSDHSRVILNLRQYEANKGPGLWKFNNNLASDAEYTKELSELIDQKKMQYDNYNPNKKWELIKYGNSQSNMEKIKEKGQEI